MRAAQTLTHGQIWAALDRLAVRGGLSPSGLAKKAGLDPTTFNKSKRVTPDGRPRWPSTESVSKALAATATPIESFVALIGDGTRAVTQSVPLIGFAQAGTGGFFDDGGFPVGKGWDEIAFPGVSDEHAYALEISGDSMEPAYRKGDIIVVAPAASLTTAVSRSVAAGTRLNFPTSMTITPTRWRSPAIRWSRFIAKVT